MADRHATGTVAPRTGGPVTLSARLRDHTREAHARAERSGIVSDILRGRATVAGYRLLLRNLQPVYAAMEQRLAGTGGALGALARPAVYRAPALAADLEVLAGPAWAAELPVLEAGVAYAARAEATDLACLAAHAYVRYLGDLNGGRVLYRLLRERPGLGDDALAFYRFPAITDVDRFIADCRCALDGLAGAVDPDEVVDEAERAFQLNIALSEAVQATAPRDRAQSSP